ncbi:MAG TPA: polysaccharide pyruvyl transferase family protein [Gemmatimonadaceae bacterium]|nr:polysaccharide pyruvyl transferase family protein [Gemmatimonadaceae bacterium]
MTTMAQASADLCGSVEHILRRLISGRRVTALIDFPNYPNVGDSAIYLGQLACLRSLGIRRPPFISDFRTYDRREMSAVVADGVILLAGGGTFGDLWPTAQNCREEILNAFPDNPVIQLPQSMHFDSQSAFDRARTVVEAHSNLTLLWRDTRSLELAKRDLESPSELCPDMAYALDPLNRSHASTQKIVWLSRRDRERAHDPPRDYIGSTDWLDESHTLLRRTNYGLMGATLRARPRKLWRRALMATYSPLAKQRLERGIAKLSAGNVVITDRLHGAILAMMLGIPSVLLDNAHGKLSAFYHTWLQEVEGVHLADSAADALRLANDIADNAGASAHAPTAR